MNAPAMSYDPLPGQQPSSLKCILPLSRHRVRGRRGAQDEFVPAAIARNLRRLAKLVTNPTLFFPHPTTP
jgi:hypothetical protein